MFARAAGAGEVPVHRRAGNAEQGGDLLHRLVPAASYNCCAIAAWSEVSGGRRPPTPVDFRISVSASRQTVTIGTELLGELPR